MKIGQPGTARANMWKAVEYVNLFRPGVLPLATIDMVTENVRGLTTIRIRGDRFKTRDTLAEMMILMKDHLGAWTAGGSTGPEQQEYEWKISETRWVRLVYKGGIGTFVQLIDKGAPRYE